MDIQARLLPDERQASLMSKTLNCMWIGRLISRTECGLATAAWALKAGKSDELKSGLHTARMEVVRLKELLKGDSAKKKIARIESAADALYSKLTKPRTISAKETKKMFSVVQMISVDVGALINDANLACSGKGKK